MVLRNMGIPQTGRSGRNHPIALTQLCSDKQAASSHASERDLHTPSLASPLPATPTPSHLYPATVRTNIPKLRRLTALGDGGADSYTYLRGTEAGGATVGGTYVHSYPKKAAGRGRQHGRLG